MADDVTSLAGLSLERLRSFCDIVASGSVVAAARKHGVSQGQYSRQIRDLENALETKLFNREGKFLKLTAEGVKLSALTKSYFTALSELRDGPEHLGKPLRLGAAESIIRWILFPRFPEVSTAVGNRLDIESHSTVEIVEKLEAGELDLGIFRADAASSELETFPFPSLSYVLMVPRTLLPDKSATAIRSVTDLPLVMLAGDGRFVSGAEQVIRSNELPARVISRVQMFSLAIQLAKTLSAATFVPSVASSEFSLNDYATIKLRGIEQMERKLVVGVSKQTAMLNSRARRAAVKLSRAYESIA